MRLIDADALDMYECLRSYYGDAWRDAQKAIDDAPTVDAEPVRHGHWIFNPKDAIEMMFTVPKCSECGAESSDGDDYCPHCGAKMDEVENEQ